MNTRGPCGHPSRSERRTGERTGSASAALVSRDVSYTVSRASGFGELWLHPPVTGRWPWGASLPREVLLGGRRFRITGWALPTAGVRAQYRSLEPVWSAHLHVYRDGTYAVTHLDRVSPRASALRHLATDTTLGKTIARTWASMRPPG